MLVTSNRIGVLGASLAGLLYAGTSSSQAANVVWNGSAAPDVNWDTGTNWTNPTTPDTKPGTADQARVVATTSGTAVQLTTAQSVNQLRVGLSGSAGHLQISNNLSVLDTSESNANHIGDGATGVVTQTAGTFATAGGVFVGTGSASGNGTFNLSGGAMTANYLFIGRATSAVGAINQTGGSVTLSDGGDALRIGAANGATATYTISAGSVNANRMVLGAEGNAATTGTMIVRDEAQVTAGNAFIIGSNGTGILVLDGSKTGAGTDVRVTSDRFTWTNNVLVPGTLRALIDSDAIATPSAMRKVATQAITINAGSLLDVGFAPGTTPAAGTWTVVSWAGSDPTNNVAFAPGVDTAHWSFSLNNATNTLSVTYTVPEPASLGALSLAGAVLMRRRRA